ncbi:MAG: hypothetical protein PHW13_01315 [Methylococcales bacterium]|nr:hypothetical protein [Methylococcales bacterium]
MRPVFILGSALFLMASAANASLIVTYAEDPGVENSTLLGTDVETFNNLKAGTEYTNLAWKQGGVTIGTFDNVYISAANQYGGAGSNGSNYAVESGLVGSPNNVEVSTLTLNTASAYFGFWWSAGDANNTVEFYNGSTLVGEFTTATLMDQLPGSYYGNPRSPSTLDSNEPFAFINFFGTNGLTFNKVVFVDTSSSGFEADNYTVRTQAWGGLSGETGTVPGVALETISGATVTLASSAIPEPDSALLLLVGMGAFFGASRFSATTVRLA